MKSGGKAGVEGEVLRQKLADDWWKQIIRKWANGVGWVLMGDGVGTDKRINMKRYICG